MILAAIDTCRGVLDSMVTVRKEMREPTGIPHWCVERIERGLRNHPEAMKDCGRGDRMMQLTELPTDVNDEDGSYRGRPMNLA